jgi:cob(I)alamin adenosyltransferase
VIQIYCGDGKGKTTASLGLVLRAAGAGMRVRFVQLLKGGHTSELASLARLPGVTVCRCDRDYGFTCRMNEEEKAAITACHNALLRDAMQALQEGTTDLLVLDEFCATYNHGLLDRALAEQLVLTCPSSAELVLTGRDPAQFFLDAADYISEIHAVRHPYTKGIAAREGIEY